MTTALCDTAAELSATAADLAAAIDTGEPTATLARRARDLTDTITIALADAPPLPDGGGIGDFAAVTAEHLRDHFNPATLPIQQVLALAEEAGEFTAAYRRWAGMARREGTWQDVCDELADVLITAHVTAYVLGIDLDVAWRAKAQVVLSRGWRDNPTAHATANTR